MDLQPMEPLEVSWGVEGWLEASRMGIDKSTATPFPHIRSVQHVGRGDSERQV